jgi:predicted  nucleic acid-binding Zn-ribbon protein
MQSMDISAALSELQTQRQDIEAKIAAIEPQLRSVPVSEQSSRVAIKALPQLNNVNAVATAMAQMNVQLIAMSRQLENLNEQTSVQNSYIALQSTAIALHSQRNNVLQQEVALQSTALAQSSGVSTNKNNSFENRVMYHISFLFPLKVQTLQDYRSSTTERITALSNLVSTEATATPVVEN